MIRRMREVLGTIREWGDAAVAATVVGRDGARTLKGDPRRVFPWASVTKLVTAYAVLRAVEAGRVALDEPAGPPGSTVRHLLAHASGLGFEAGPPVSAPERTRIYSNPGYDALGELLAARTGRPIAEVLRQDVLALLGMTGARLDGSPAHGLRGTIADLAALGRELLEPTLVTPATLREATTVQFPGLSGVLPGVGRFDPLDWGLGFELRDGKQPHWTGRRNSPATFGHFGASGSFLWVDPEAGLAVGCLGDRPFGPWALEAWPALSDAVLEAVGPGRA